MSNKVKSPKEKSERAVEKPEAREAVEAQTPKAKSKTKSEEKTEAQREKAVVVSITRDTKSTQDSVQQGHKVIKKFPKCDSQQQTMKGSKMIENTITSVSAVIEEAKTFIANAVPAVKSIVATVTNKVQSLYGAKDEITLSEEEIRRYAKEE